MHRISSREALNSPKKPLDRKQIHPAFLEFQIQVATDFSLDNDKRMCRFLLMMIRQIWDKSLDNTDT
jgi:hypothetical protein